MRKLSESIFNAGIERNQTGEFKTEDKGKTITIDGVKYILDKEFIDEGDIFTEKNKMEWQFFAFNKPKSGNIIKGCDTDNFSYGIDHYDLKKYFETYYLKDFIDKTPEQLVDNILNNGNIDDIYRQDIKDLIKSYVKKLVINDLSDVAHYNIYHYWPADVCYDKDRTYLIRISYNTDLQNIRIEDLEDKDGSAIYVSFPLFNDEWANNFEKDIINIFKQNGWEYSEEYDLDPYGEMPTGTRELCFYTIDEDEEEEE